MNAKAIKPIAILVVALNLGWPVLSSAGPSDQGTWGERQVTTQMQSADQSRCEKGYRSDHLNPKGIQAWYQPADCQKAASPCPYAGRASYQAGPPAAKGFPFSPRQGVHC